MATRSGKYYHHGTKRKRSSTKDTTLDNNNTPNEEDVDNLNISNMSTRELRGRKTNVKDAFEKDLTSGRKIEAGNATESNWIISSVVKKSKRKAKGNAEKEPENDLNASKVLKPLRRRRSNVAEDAVETVEVNTTNEKDTENNNVPDKDTNVRTSKKGKENVKDLSVRDTDDQKDMEVDVHPDEVTSKQSKKKKKKVKGSKKKKQKIKPAGDISLDKGNNGIEDSKDVTDKNSDNNIEKESDVKSPKVLKKTSRNRNTNIKDVADKPANTTFEKEKELDSSVNNKETKTGADVTYDKNNDTFEKDASTSFDTFKRGAITRKSSIRDKNTSVLSLTREDLENDKDIISSSASKRKPNKRQNVNNTDTQNLDSTFDNISNYMETETVNISSPAAKRRSLRRQTTEINDSPAKKLDSTFDKVTNKDESLAKEDIGTDKLSLLSPAAKRKSIRRQTIEINDSPAKKLDSTFDKVTNKNQSLVNEDIETNKSLFSPTGKGKSLRQTIEKTNSPAMKLNSTFDKVINKNESLVKEDIGTDKVSLLSPAAKRKSIKRQTIEINDSPAKKLNSTFDKVINKNESLVKEDIGTDKVSLLSPASKRKSIRRQTIEINDTPAKKLDSTFDKVSHKNQSLVKEDFEISKVSLLSPASKRKSLRRQTIDISDTSVQKLDSTFDKSTKNLSLVQDDIVTGNINILSPAKRKSIRRQTIDINNTNSPKMNSTFDKSSNEGLVKESNISHLSPASQRKSLRRQTMDFSPTQKLDSTNDKSDDTTEVKRKSLRLSEAATEQKLNTTFEKETVELEKISASLISSDNSVSDKSEISRISITSDDTVEDIGNTTPVLIESSMEASLVKDSPKPQTPLKREGTFTKEGPEVQAQSPQTPGRRSTANMPPAGCTPYHVSKSSNKKLLLNVTRSIEKRSPIELAPRLTRVMFCSPVDNPVLMAQEKRKVIKSNLKGSNKSFVFDESASVSRVGRKRSYTQSDAEDSRAKRSRLTEDLQQSVNRLSRPRTTSAAGKLTDTTPKKPLTTFSSKSDSKSSRTKLPNFAALHQKQFDKMESLDECQERKAKRARQMLTPNGPTNVLDRVSPKNETEPQKPAKETKPKEKTDTPTKKSFTLESLRPGFTRFGFKLNVDIPNPFTVPLKTDKKEKPNGVAPRVALPSLAGATSMRREVAKQTVMREKSILEKKRNINRNENRTIIKGVRTNRRFELQMKLRNIE